MPRKRVKKKKKRPEASVVGVDKSDRMIAFLPPLIEPSEENDDTVESDTVPPESVREPVTAYGHWIDCEALEGKNSALQRFDFLLFLPYPLDEGAGPVALYLQDNPLSGEVL